MDNLYTAYTKEIDGVIFYFVKKYQTFPEFTNVPPLLENYGMHTDFRKACKIASIYDEAVQEQLSATVQLPESRSQIIKMNRNKLHLYNFKNWQIIPSMLKLLKVR